MPSYCCSSAWCAPDDPPPRPPRLLNISTFPQTSENRASVEFHGKGAKNSPIIVAVDFGWEAGVVGGNNGRFGVDGEQGGGGGSGVRGQVRAGEGWRERRRGHTGVAIRRSLSVRRVWLMSAT